MKRLALITASMLVKAVLNFAALIVFARILTPGEYGIYSLILTLVLLVDSFAFSWLRTSYTRFFTEADAAKHRANISHILYMYLGISAVCVVLAAFGSFIYPIPGMAPWLWLVVGGMMVGEGLFNLQLSHANNARREKRFLAISALKSLSGLSLGWLLVTQGYGVAGILVAQLLAYILTALPLLKVRHNIKRYLVWQPDATVAKLLLVFGLPLAVMGVLESTITAAHRSMVFHLLGPESLGVYAVSNDLVQKVLIFIMLTLNTAMLPVIIKALETGGPTAAQNKLRESATLLAGVALPAALGMSLFATQICDVLLGAQYRDTASVLLPWFILAALAKCSVSYYLAHAFYLTKSNRKLIPPMLAVTGLSMLACYFGILQFGIYGALAAIILTWVVYATVVAYMGRRQFAMPAPWAEWSRILTATLVMGIAVFPLRNLHGLPALIAAGAVGGTLYAALLLALNVAGSRKHLTQLKTRFTSKLKAR